MILLLALLFCLGFFSAAETALTSLRRIHIGDTKQKNKKEIVLLNLWLYKSTIASNLKSNFSELVLSKVGFCRFTVSLVSDLYVFFCCSTFILLLLPSINPLETLSPIIFAISVFQL